ncbi:MAG: translational GTPase TypA [Clostridia bacterium]|nr:translational GTPase TypA [Clostridia bacterium]
MANEKVRNIAIIAHVDHGKTSLVNELLKQGNVFHEKEVVEDRVMDSNALEKERGITILAKNTSCIYDGIKINIVDTPGHADFGGEVERVLKMVDGVLLVVDSYEGPMPQTRFVLEKALALNLKVIVVVNKIDKPDARLGDVQEEVLELLLNLDANDEQLSSPFVFCSARFGHSSLDLNSSGTDMKPLFNTILSHIPSPSGDESKPFKMLISSAEQNDFVGKLVIGKIVQGKAKVGDNVVSSNFHENKNIRGKIVQLFEFMGLKRVPVANSRAGDIVCIAGVEAAQIGDTLCSPEDISPIEFVKIDPPTVEMTFMVNDSPFAGKEGKFVTSRHLRERLYKEAIKDLSLRVTDTNSTDSFVVCGRGEMHLSILIENMRREGYEFQVSMPKVLFIEENGKKLEPIDKLIIDVPIDSVGTVMSKMGVRKGELLHMRDHNNRMKMEFLIPERGLFGFKSEFLTDTRGEGIMNSIFFEYQPYKGNIERRMYGSLIAHETGDAIPYGLFNAQERGDLFIGAGQTVYSGMIVGQNPKGEDIVVNVCKKKHLSNCRTSSSDEALRLTPIKQMSLEDCMEFISDDELMEVTPKNVRLRKKTLDPSMRLRERGKAKN